MKNVILSNMKHLFDVLDPYDNLDPTSEMAGRLRAAQMASIFKTAPFMMVAKLLCATLIFFSFYKEPSGWFLPYWTITLYLLAAVGLNQSYQNRNRGPVLSASLRAPKQAIKAAFISGVLWAIMPVLLYPNIPEGKQGIIIAVMSGMMGGGVLSLYAVPLSMVVWLSFLTIGSVIGLLLSPSFASFILLGMLVIYAVSILRAGYSIAKTFTANVLTGFELSNQSETIDLLLKDFSENASDWLWEMDTTGQITRGHYGFSSFLKTTFQSISPSDYQRKLSSEKNQLLNMRSLEGLRKNYIEYKNFRDIVISSSGEEGSRWVSMAGKPLYNQKNEFLGFRGVASDITEKNIQKSALLISHTMTL